MTEGNLDSDRRPQLDDDVSKEPPADHHLRLDPQQSATDADQFDRALSVCSENRTPTHDGALVVDAAEFAQLLKVSTKTLDRMLIRQKLPRPILIGRQRRWRLQEIEQWVAAGAPSQREWERMKTTKREA